MSTQDKPANDTSTAGSKIQGEGDYEATRRYDQDTEKFLKAANVEELARKAAPKSKAEADEMQKAEEIGKSHRADVKGDTGAKS